MITTRIWGPCSSCGEDETELDVNTLTGRMECVACSDVTLLSASELLELLNNLEV